jgi:aspartyl protease family protein
VIDRFVLMALTPMTLAGGALGWTSIRDGGATPAPVTAAVEGDAASGQRHSIARASDGLFHAHVAVNGRRMRMVIDTGATQSILSRRSLSSLRGVTVSAGSVGTIRTLGGDRRYRNAHVDTVAIGSRRISAVDFAVVDTPSDLSIIGQDVLRELGPIILDGDTLTLP